MGIRESLYRYYHENGKYPAKLADLTEDIMEHGYPAKRCPEVLQMLNEFVYETDGTYYEISYQTEYRNVCESHKEHAVKGKMVFAERCQNGQLRSRHEYSGEKLYPFSGFAKKYRDGKLILIIEYKDGEMISEKAISDDQVIEK